MHSLLGYQQIVGLSPHPLHKSHGKAHLHEPREHNGRQQSKLKPKRKGDPVWSSPRAVPAKPQPPYLGVKPIPMSHGEQLSKLPPGLREIASWGCETHKEM